MKVSKHVQKIIDEYGISVTDDMEYVYTINHSYGSVNIMKMPEKLSQELTDYTLFPVVAPYPFKEGDSSKYTFTWDYDKKLWKVQYAVTFIGGQPRQAYKNTAKYSLKSVGEHKYGKEEAREDSKLTPNSIPLIRYDTDPLPCVDDLKPMTASDIFKYSFRGNMRDNRGLYPMIERAMELSPWKTIYSNSKGQ